MFIPQTNGTASGSDSKKPSHEFSLSSIPGWDEDVIREDIAQIKENIYYDEMSARYRAEYNSRFDELFEVMVDLVAGKRESLNIGETEYPQWLVRKRILSLTASHVEYVMGMIAENLGKIHNMRKYMIASLFNAPTTMDNYFTQLVHHDMHTEEWYEMSQKMAHKREAERNAQEQELNDKLTRLAELNSLLDMDEKGEDAVDLDEDATKPEPEKETAEQTETVVPAQEADTEVNHISEDKAEISEKAEESDISNTDDAEEPVTKPESKEERPSLIARLNEKKAVVAAMDQKAPAVAKKKEEVIA